MFGAHVFPTACAYAVLSKCWPLVFLCWTSIIPCEDVFSFVVCQSCGSRRCPLSLILRVPSDSSLNRPDSTRFFFVSVFSCDVPVHTIFSPPVGSPRLSSLCFMSGLLVVLDDPPLCFGRGLCGYSDLVVVGRCSSLGAEFRMCCAYIRTSWRPLGALSHSFRAWLGPPWSAWPLWALVALGLPDAHASGSMSLLCHWTSVLCPVGSVF